MSSHVSRPCAPSDGGGRRGLDGLVPAVLVRLVELRDLDLDLERVDDLASRRRNSRRADDRCDRSEHAADLSGSRPISFAAARFSGMRPAEHRPQRALRRERASASPNRGWSLDRAAVMLRVGRGPGSRWLIQPCCSFLEFVGFQEAGCGAPHRRPRSRSAARSCRRTARAGCRGAGSGTSPCPRWSGSSCPQGCPSGRSGPNVSVVEPSGFGGRRRVGYDWLPARGKRCGVCSMERVWLS